MNVLNSLLVLLLVPTFLVGQQHPKSPVFKDQATPDPVSLIEPSTATYDLWQVFMLTRKANAGDPVAQHDLGVRYLLGKGVAADTIKGAHWIQKAAMQNVIPARFNLGILQYHGWGVEWDPFESYNNFVYCSDQDMDEARYVLGQFLTDGLVVARDYGKAKQIVSDAVARGYEPATKMLDQIEKMEEAESKGDSDSSDSFLPDSLYEPVFLNMDEDSLGESSNIPLLRDVLRSGREEVKYAFGDKGRVADDFDPDSIDFKTLEESAGTGSPEALVLLGKFYETGTMVGSDRVLAASYFLRAFRLGSRRAAELLWELTREGDFFRTLTARSAQHDPEAQYVWATLHSLGLAASVSGGRSVLTDPQALKMLEGSASKMNAAAMIELGLCNLAGKWVPADREKAIEYWRNASSLGYPEGDIRIAMVTVRHPESREELDGAIAVLREGASKGSILADVALAFCQEKGIGVPQAKGIAASLYRRSAFRGSRDAYYTLRRMYDEIRPDDEAFRVDE